MDYRQMTAPCGLDCFNCPFYLYPDDPGANMYQELGNQIIRNWQMEDAKSLAKYANNKNIWLNLHDAFPHPFRLEDAEAFISLAGEPDPVTMFARSQRDRRRLAASD